MATIKAILESKPNGWRNVLAIHYLGREVEKRLIWQRAMGRRDRKARARRAGKAVA